MIGLKVDQAKGMFFDRPAVTRSMDETTAKALSRAGSKIMKTARGLIRTDRRKGKKKGSAAKAGKPPFSRTGLLRDKIYFVYDQINRSVITGPAKLNKPGNVPLLLEEGGEVMKPRKKGPPRRMVYQGNPYMAPALAKNLPKIPEQFQNTIRR